MPISGKEMVKELQRDGWRIDRIEGSHYIMEKGNRTITVPVHANRDLTQGTEARIRKLSGLQK